MKIGIKAAEFSAGKAAIKDPRIDKLQEILHSAQKIYLKADLVTEEKAMYDADGIVCSKDGKLDFILHDIEFTETRLANAEDESEKKLLQRFKEQLDREGCISEMDLVEEEKKMASSYSMLTTKPVYVAPGEQKLGQEGLLFSAYTFFGYISFFTGNEKEAHAWPIKKGASAWEASGCIHSDIQKGFIRAEVVGYDALVSDGGLSQARSNNHIRLENKDYVVQDGDYIVFRFNK
jgi:hypothetical protein